MKKLLKKTHLLKDFFRNDIWELDLEEFSKAKARFIKYLKVAAITIKTFSSEKIGFQAVALSFFSTMSVVPFLAIAFAITDGFGIAETLKDFLYQYFNNSQQTIDMVVNLEVWNPDKQYDRLGLKEQTMTILGNKVISYNIPIRPGRNVALIAETAAINHRQKKMGYNAAEELNNRVMGNIARRRRERDNQINI